MNEKEVIITSLVVQMARDYFRYLSKLFSTLLDLFSRIYGLQIADVPRNMDHLTPAAIEAQENKFESAQRLFSCIKFSEVDSIYQQAQSLQPQLKIEFFTALRDVAQ